MAQQRRQEQQVEENIEEDSYGAPLHVKKLQV
jgi:hypothetical protein